MTGSKLFPKTTLRTPHLGEKSEIGGPLSEVVALRRDVAKALKFQAFQVIEEFLDVPAAGPALLKAATATQAAAVTYGPGDLLALAGNLFPPRNVTVTTAGTTPADAPATVKITGLDIDGSTLTETITVAQTATIASGTKCFAKVTKIELPAGEGAGATLAFGIGSVLGLTVPVQAVAGFSGLLEEIVDGALLAPPTGAFTSPGTNAPYGAYAPATAPNGVHDYAFVYLGVPRALGPPERIELWRWTMPGAPMGLRLRCFWEWLGCGGSGPPTRARGVVLHRGGVELAHLVVAELGQRAVPIEPVEQLDRARVVGVRVLVVVGQ